MAGGGIGRRWANHRLQARPAFAWLFVLSPPPGLPEPENEAFLEVGTARCAVPSRVERAELMLANTRITMTIAPLNAARTAQRAVPTPVELSRCGLINGA